MRKALDDAVATVVRGTVKIDVHIDNLRLADVAVQDVADNSQRQIPSSFHVGQSPEKV